MPGIAQQPSQGIETGSLAAIGQDRSTVAPINDFMEAFRSGFLTVDDLTKRAQNKPLENSQRATALQADDLQRKQLAAQGQLLPGQIQNAQAEQQIQATLAPAKQIIATQQAQDAQLFATDPEAFHAKKSDDAAAQAYIEHRGKLPEFFTVKNPEKPLSFSDWADLNKPAIEARQQALIANSADDAAYVAATKADNTALFSEWQKYVQGAKEIRAPKGSPEYAKELHRQVNDLQEADLIKGAKVKALPTILENNAKGAAPKIEMVKRVNAAGKEEEVQIRTDPQTGEVLGETILATNPAKLSESQANTQLFANRLGYNDRVLTGLEAKGFDPSAIGSSVQKFLPNRFRSEEVQTYTAAKDNWISAVLRKESGAAISAGEYKQANKEYFPQDGDSASVVQQKQGLRKFAEEQMHKIAGPGGQSGQGPGYVGLDKVIQNGTTFQWNGTAYVPVK